MPSFLTFIIIVLFTRHTTLDRRPRHQAAILNFAFPVPDKCADFAALQH
jgi:hypothetical protein